ncbi:CPBP family intramembrane glutamic endopeptidase [uncultured Brevundimonas sp.]|uniref:CPBP family intramembrane glutamic endopeptidase n=1 Tax=uncultured Brevundimonas sp. TaxID=213418 RepID=UPI0030EEEEB0|tara:strand:- start:39945 stop:40826 length:882 start_codon:yes stop_codon:yes gene_type:complete
MTLRRLSQFVAIALAALTWWALVSRTGAVEPESAMEINATLAAVVAAVFGLSFVALRFATAGSAIYWSGDAGPRQVGRIGLMIAAVVGLQLGAGRVLNMFGMLDPLSAIAIYLLAWTMVPAAFLQFGLVKWPTRLRSASKLRLFLAGVVGVGVAAAWSYAAYSAEAVAPISSPVGELAVTLAALVVGATAEEVVFRVLFLTALLHLPVSRFQAVFLSSVAFGLMHVPFALAEPIVHADWPRLQVVAFEYAPKFLMQTSLGLFLGVLWLRTGSLVLIALSHFIWNVGVTLATGL